MRKIVSFLLLITSVIVISSCASTKRKCRLKPFQELDSLQASKKVINYDMLLPGKWEQSRFSSGDWYYVKGKYIDSLGYHITDADVYISSKNVKSKCVGFANIEDFLQHYIKIKQRFYIEDFNYLLLSSNHRNYGKVYILRFDKIVNDSTYANSVFLFFHNNTGYIIDYRTDKKFFETYLPDVEKMVNSFTLDK